MKKNISLITFNTDYILNILITFKNTLNILTTILLNCFFLHFNMITKKFFFFFLLRKTGENRWERVGEKHQCKKHHSVASHMHPDQDWTCKPGMCPDQESNRWPFALQDEVQLSVGLSGQLLRSFKLYMWLV